MWSIDANNWSSYKEETAFTFFDDIDDDEPSNMTYADAPWFQTDGYEIVEFEELRRMPDIDESDMSISFLVGGGV